MPMLNEFSAFILNKISSSMINDSLDITNNANDLRNRISARFFYDRLGRIVVSQNSRQQLQNRFSYSLYDALGRVVEAGEKTENTPGANVLAFAQIFGAYVGGNLVPSVIDDTKLASWLNTQATNTRKEITRSYYDRTNTSILAQLPSNFTPDPLTQRKRIVHVTYETAYDSNDATYDHATHYDYDIHGNVKTLLQDNADLGALNQLASQRFKRMDYTFDLISGNVHRVDYETNKADQWHHAYSYDADNRITAVYTTSATPLVNDPLAMSSLQNEPLLNPTWEKEAAYSYYAHGPLVRTVIGEQEVQGLDYVYTLQGWIKGVNSNNLDANNDPGKDGLGLSANHRVAQDVMGYSLHYFNNDYLPIVNGNTTFIADQTNSDMLQNSSDLYNGNIARMVTTITDPNSRAVLPLGNAYRYDQLNRLKHAVSFDQLNGNAWAGGAPAKYENSFTYDANGNILTQTRNDDNNQVIDELAYFYPQNAANKTVRNRLLYVSDNVDYDASDIDPGMATNNYAYDQEGRLIQDLQEQIASIEWRVDGKVKRINRIANSTKQNLSFDYDAMGHRIAKHVYTSANVLEKSTYYVLDAQGNTMATYERAVDENTLQISFAQTEKFIYGSARLGVQNVNIGLLGSQNNAYTQTTVAHRIGKKGYELSNHLGNVLSVISDKVIPHSNGTIVDYWLADILQSTDYSPFGVQLSGRNLKLSGNNVPYVYGFNGMIKDDELKGEGNSYDFGARMLDSRLGRWLSIDPKAAKFVSESSYIFVGNNPIICIDPDGEEKIVVSGGADLHNKNRMNFASAAQNQIREFKKTIKKNKSSEAITWLVLDLDYTAKQKTSMETYAKKNGVNLIYVNSDKEIVNYINSKKTSSLGISQVRKDDQISSLSIMSHGVPGALPMGYENTGWDKNPTYRNSTVFSSTDIQNINKNAFEKNSNIVMYTCNSATPSNMTAKDFPSQDALVEEALSGNNLVKSFSSQIPDAYVTGFIGQTSYSRVGYNGNGELPSPATMDGSYSPTVNKKAVPTIKVTMKNGKVN